MIPVSARSIAVISLQRLGDALTGARVTDAWARRRGISAVEVIHWDRVRDAAALLPGTTALHGLPYAALRARGRIHPLAAYAALEAIVDGIGRRRFDTVINLTSTRFASLLAPLLARDPAEIHGPWIDDAGTYRASHPAIDHLNAWGVDPSINVFAHQDLYATAARVRLNAYAGLPLDATAETLVSHAGASHNDGPIALHLHGSEAAKDWRPAEAEDGWVGLARALRERSGRPVLLLGSASEMPELDRVAAASGAETAAWPLRHTAALLRRCSGLISVDTVAIHIAAQVGCPTVVLRQGTARGLAFVPGPKALLVDRGPELATVSDVVQLAERHFFGHRISNARLASMMRRIRVRRGVVDDNGYLGAGIPSWWPASDAHQTVAEVEQLWRRAWISHFRGDAPPADVLARLRRFAVVDSARWARACANPGGLGRWLDTIDARRAA